MNPTGENLIESNTKFNESWFRWICPILQSQLETKAASKISMQE